MNDLISREEVLNLIDTAFENGAFDGRYAYENLVDAIQNLIHPLEKESCEDAVSRQAAIDALSHMMDTDGFRDGWAVSRANVDCMLRRLPSVEPERKPGK